MTTPDPSDDRERADLLDVLAKHRGLFLQTLDGLSDEQASRRPTASALCLGGLVKHVAQVEEHWVDFILRGPDAMAMTEESMTAHDAAFEMQPGERLEDILVAYADVAARTTEVVRSLPSLDVGHPLPEAPWFEPGASWTARRAIVHIVAETAQHAGHADIIRESIDGAKTMG